MTSTSSATQDSMAVFFSSLSPNNDSSDAALESKPSNPGPSQRNPIGNRAAAVGTTSQYCGALWLLLAEFIASVMALTTRYLETHDASHNGKLLHPFNIISWRMTIGFATCLALGWWNRIPDFPLGRKDLRPLLRLRALGGFVGVVGFYYALTALPLPDATVISFLVPTLVGIACSIMPGLREPFTRLERVSALVSFVGVVLIARPLFLFPDHKAKSGPPIGVSDSMRVMAVVIALIGVCGSSTAYTCLRWLGNQTDPLVPVAYFTGLGAIASLFCLVAIPTLPGFVLPSGGLEYGMALGLGLGGFVMQWALTKGMALVKGSVGAQIIAAQLVFSILWEFVVWGDFPTGTRLLGMALIVVSITIVSIYKGAHSGTDCALVTDEEGCLLDSGE